MRFLTSAARTTTAKKAVRMLQKHSLHGDCRKTPASTQKHGYLTTNLRPPEHSWHAYPRKNEENTSKMQHQRTCSNQNVRNPPQLDLRIPPGLGWHVKPSSRVTHLSRPSVCTEFAWIFFLHMLPTRIFKYL